MKNLLSACLPALALLALGGCAGTSALTSSEDDGVYYSSKDRTTAVVSTAPAPASASEEANPDYNGNTATAPSSSAQRGSGSTQYYDNSYTYMRGVPGYGATSAYGPGLSYYTPYSPYTTLSYSPFGSVCTGYGYGWGGGACGYSPYAYGGYDPFYSSYGYGYSPYYGYGSGVSISFGFGRPYYGGYGYSPYGYGYGYSPYYYGSSYYGGYYGRGGYYGNSYGGNYGSNNGGYYGGDNRGSGRTYGHRTDRASEGRYSSSPASTGGSAPTGGHARSEVRAANNPEQIAQAPADQVRTRRDVDSPAMQPQSGGFNQPQPMGDAVRPRYRNMEAPIANQPTAADPSYQRNRTETMQPQIQPAATPQEDRRRGGFFQNILGERPAATGQAAEQPRQRYEQPRQQTYEQPRQQTYEQPQRSYSQPSYSAPSYGGGGGNSGGGGGGGGHRGRD